MGLTEKQIMELKEYFNNSFRPVILFDDDLDGLSSFIMVYNHIGEGKGIPVKNSPEITVDYAKKVNDYEPDLVIILDKPKVSQEFIDKVRAKIVWLDHHPIDEKKGVMYFNPRLSDPDDSRPTAYWVYKVLKKNLWLAMAGIVGDWHLPEQEIIDEFKEKYPSYLTDEANTPEKALHDTRLGRLIRAIDFNLKGKVSEVMKSIKILTRIKDPDEILNETTARGRFIFKKFSKLNTIYEGVLKSIKVNNKDKFLLVKYQTSDYSFSSVLSNELLYKHPDKMILVAWEYDGEYKCSLRTSEKTGIDIPVLIDKSLDGVKGYGGGHKYACGACIKKDDFDLFIKNIRKNI